MKTIACLLCAILCLLGSTSVCLADDAPLDIYDEAVSIDNYSKEGFVEESSMMYVCASPYVRLRQTDSTDLPYLDKMPYGSMVTVVSTQTNEMGEEWSLVIYNEKYGYCMTEYLSYEIDLPASEACPMNMEEAFGTALLQRGNDTPSYTVKNLQLCLMEGGFLDDDKGADGYFGKNTYKALCAFQKSQGLDAAGRAGNITKTRLWYLYADFLMENGVMQ